MAEVEAAEARRYLQLVESSLRTALKEIWKETEHLPNTLLMPWRTYVVMKRYMMTKRRFRRWRGKMKEQMRRG
jgi:hypothetical protein